MLNRIRDFFLWLSLWLEEPAKHSNADQIILYVLVLCHFAVFYIITLLVQFYI